MSTTATETKQPPTKPDTTKKRVTLTQRDARLGLWLMSPTLLVVLAIVIFPLLWSILMSFQRMRLIQIGRADFFEPLTLANYERVLGSSTFWTSLLITFVYTFGSVVLAISLGVLAAMARTAAVPRPELRPCRLSAALRRTSGGGDLHLAHHAQSAVRDRQCDRPERLGLG